jgi:hypothetical protein
MNQPFGASRRGIVLYRDHSVSVTGDVVSLDGTAVVTMACEPCWAEKRPSGHAGCDHGHGSSVVS